MYLQSCGRGGRRNMDASHKACGRGEIQTKGEAIMLFARESAERGQGLVEYALILVLVAIVVIAALMILGPIIGNTFSTINNSLTGV
jgi:pilus assembly protein Flp/PilA